MAYVSGLTLLASLELTLCNRLAYNSDLPVSASLNSRIKGMHHYTHFKSLKHRRNWPLKYTFLVHTELAHCLSLILPPGCALTLDEADEHLQVPDLGFQLFHQLLFHPSWVDNLSHRCIHTLSKLLGGQGTDVLIQIHVQFLY